MDGLGGSDVSQLLYFFFFGYFQYLTRPLTQSDRIVSIAASHMP